MKPTAAASDVDTARATARLGWLDDETRVTRAAWVAVFATAALSLTSRFYSGWILDDALMFVRYARNLLDTGVVAWNPGGPATYGLTAPLYLIVVVPVVAVLRDRECEAILVASMISAIIALITLSRLVVSEARCLGATGRFVAPFLLLAVLGPGSRFKEVAASGMDTLFATAYVAAVLMSLALLGRNPPRRTEIAIGALAGLAFLVRPDTLLLTCGPLALQALVARGAVRRAHAVALAAAAAVILVSLFGCHAYFDSALPLAFYAKNTSIYGAEFALRYRWQALGLLLTFASGYAPVLAPIACAALVMRRALFHLLTPRDRAVALSAASFIAFHAAATTPIMGMNARFYVPALPALLLLAHRSATGLVLCLGATLSDEHGRRAAERVARRVGALALLLFATRAVVASSVDLVRSVRGHWLGASTARESYRAHFSRQWVALEPIAALPDDLVIATTEVGMPGALAPRKTIVDIAGLNEARLAHGKFSGDDFLARYAPDVLYMPHPDYVAMVRSLETSERFNHGYERFTAGDLAADKFGLALRKDSPHFAELRAAVTTLMPSCDERLDVARRRVP